MNHEEDQDFEVLESEKPPVTRVELSKGCGGSKLFVQCPSISDHKSEFRFKNDHFGGENTSQSDKRWFKKSNIEPHNSSGEELHATDEPVRLPYGIELSGGVGSVRRQKQQSGKSKSMLPSETLFSTASLLKSLFTSQGSSDEKESTPSASEGEETVKNKMLMLWHNVKYGWSSGIKTNFSKETPVYLLGKIYHSQFNDSDSRFSNLDNFKRDFYSLVWFTYRLKFPPLPNSDLTSDCGWGCMIRSGQMITATALRRHYLPANWWYQEGCMNTMNSIHTQIVKWFCDSPEPSCPFSLHNLLRYGQKIDKKAGSWFGPSCIAHLMKEALEAAREEFSSLERMAIYVAQDGAVYVQDVLDLCSTGRCLCSDATELPPHAETTVNPTLNRASSMKEFSSLREKRSCSNSWEKITDPDKDFEIMTSDSEADSPLRLLDYYVNSNTKSNDSGSGGGRIGDISYDSGENVCNVCRGWRSCLLLIPVRLGGAVVNPIYFNCIYSLFLHDLCVGMIGGRPKHSLYFVGFQEDNLIYLDPHRSQDYIPFDSLRFNLSLYHCSSPRKMPISKMDPSATIGFYCHTREQFYRLLEEVPMFTSAKDGNLDSRIFEFIDGRNEQVNGWVDNKLSMKSKTTEEILFD